MRNWLKGILLRLSGKVYRAMGGDTLELTRQARNLLTVGHAFTEPEGERIEFLKKMSALADNPLLQWLNASIVAEQARLTYEEARNLDEVNLARGTSNGLLLQQQRLNVYKNELEELKTKEDFDKFSPL